MAPWTVYRLSHHDGAKSDYDGYNFKDISVIKHLYPPAEWWTRNGLPIPVHELKFHSIRKWRFDYYFPGQNVAIEIEGGAHKYGRHNRPKGFFTDMEKYNAAAEMGIFVLRYQSVNKINVDQVKKVLTQNVNKGIFNVDGL